MDDSKYRIVKDNWSNRPKLHASHGLSMRHEDHAEGDEILDVMQRVNTSTTEENDERGVESAWVKSNREEYETGRCSYLKEEVARQLREEQGFETTGNPVWDIGIGMAWREFKEWNQDTESEGNGSSNLDGSVGKGGEAESESESNVEKEVESTWVEQNRREYETGGCSYLKEEVARQLREEQDFETTGNPEWDIGIGMAWREFKEWNQDTESEGNGSSNLDDSAMESGAAELESESNVEKEVESTWVKQNREEYEAGRCSYLKEEVARQLREEHNFETTGNPEWDIGIGMAWKEFREMNEDTEPEENVSSNLGGESGVMKPKSKRQLKRGERRRECKAT